VRGPEGGLCGLASLYQALENTVLSVSQLRQYTYLAMRAALMVEIGSNSIQIAELNDAPLLDKYYTSKCCL
jgi:hypothetical protein